MTDDRPPAEEGPRPLVTIVTAVYNRWPLVAETIESVLNQTCQDFELIVVDDGSTDGTADHVERNYPTVRVVRQENTERGEAFNHGFRLSRGRFVSIVGSDDVCEPWHLSQFEEAQRRSPDTKAFASRAWLWDPETGRRRLLDDFDPATIARDALLRTAIQPQTLFVERSLLLEVGGYPSERSTAGSEDWVLLLKLTTRGVFIERLPRPSVRIRQHAGRSTSNLRFIAASREAATRLILEDDLLGVKVEPEEAKLIAAGTHRLSAAHYYGAGQMKEARKEIQEACRQVGLRTGIPWTGRLWVQTWLGKTASTTLRRLKEGVTWR
jgi:glycosyltransferase involved in cell wall biosynthesis